jgi:N12 class adenine-specific DNA methylase
MMPRSDQVAAVTRMIGEPAVLLAHEVGAGNTAEMISVTELRWLGLGLDVFWGPAQNRVVVLSWGMSWWIRRPRLSKLAQWAGSTPSWH